MRKLIFEHHLALISVVETRVRPVNKNIMNRMFRNWEFTNNYDSHDLGKIWIGWNPVNVRLEKLSETDQIIHCKVQHYESKASFFCSFVYGANEDHTRRSLWGNICHEACNFKNDPWIFLGDFNNIRSPQEHKGQPCKWNQSMRDFEDCIQNSELIELRYSGLLYTWKNNNVARKLDRVLINEEWNVKFPHSEAEHLPPGVSDHCPSLVKLVTAASRRKSSFKFFNFLADREDFIPTVIQVWNESIQGTLQFQVSPKLKRLKSIFKEKCKEIGDISMTSKEAKSALENCQRELDQDPSNIRLRQKEKQLLANYLRAAQVEEGFYKQKARVQWLKEGDQNTSYFFKAMNNRRNRKKILSLKRMDGTTAETEEEIKREAINFFQHLWKKDPHTANRIERQ